MDWLIGILLLLVGAIIGYFVAKFVNERKLLANNDAQKEQNIKEIMSQQASEHIQTSKQILHNLTQQTEALKQQIASYEQLTDGLQANENNGSINYFGEHASQYLRHSSSSAKPEKTPNDFQPLDFSAQSSGLFSGKESK